MLWCLLRGGGQTAEKAQRLAAAAHTARRNAHPQSPPQPTHLPTHPHGQPAYRFPTQHPPVANTDTDPHTRPNTRAAHPPPPSPQPGWRLSGQHPPLTDSCVPTQSQTAHHRVHSLAGTRPDHKRREAGRIPPSTTQPQHSRSAPTESTLWLALVRITRDGKLASGRPLALSTTWPSAWPGVLSCTEGGGVGGWGGERSWAVGVF